MYPSSPPLPAPFAFCSAREGDRFSTPTDGNGVFFPLFPAIRDRVWQMEIYPYGKAVKAKGTTHGRGVVGRAVEYDSTDLVRRGGGKVPRCGACP